MEITGATIVLGPPLCQASNELFYLHQFQSLQPFCKVGFIISKLLTRKKRLYKIKKPAEDYTAKGQNGVWHQRSSDSKTHISSVLERQERVRLQTGEWRGPWTIYRVSRCQEGWRVKTGQLKSPSYLWQCRILAITMVSTYYLQEESKEDLKDQRLPTWRNEVTRCHRI